MFNPFMLFFLYFVCVSNGILFIVNVTSVYNVHVSHCLGDAIHYENKQNDKKNSTNQNVYWRMALEKWNRTKLNTIHTWKQLVKSLKNYYPTLRGLYHVIIIFVSFHFICGIQISQLTKNMGCFLFLSGTERNCNCICNCN